jgi:ribosome-associated protein
MIQITPTLFIDENEIQEEFIRSSGPGGQNVNKVASAVQLRFDILRATGLPDDMRRRLAQLCGKRVNAQGVLVIEARRFRSQERNRQDARERLVALIRKAAFPPKARRKTKPSAAAQRRRLEAKHRRSQAKERRERVGVSDD